MAPTDGILHAAPLSHGAGCYGLPHIARAAVSIIPESGHFDPAEIATLLQRWRGVSFFAAPTMVTRLIDNPGFAAADHANLKTIIYGGGPMYVADLKRALALLGPRLSQIYGQGEAPMTITGLSKAQHAEINHPRWEQRLGSTGIARTDVEVRVADETDRDVPSGQSGEVLVRGDVVMKGYWCDPAATAQTLRGGWLHTGDIGAFDEDGFLTLKDRAKDMIISGAGHRRSVDRRSAASRLGRGGHRLRRGASRRRNYGGRTRSTLSRPYRSLQAATRLSLRERIAEEQLRQGAED